MTTTEAHEMLTTDEAARLLMLTVGKFEDLIRKGWFKPVKTRPSLFRIPDVVQGYLKSIEHERTRGRTVSEAAAHIGISARRFTTLLDEGVITRKERGEYDLDDVRNEYIKSQREKLSNHEGGQGATGTLTAEKAALAREQREALELKNNVTRGDFVSLAEVERQLGPMLEVTRERLLSIPGKIGDAISMRSREECEEIIENEITEALNELSQPTQFDGGPDRTRDA